MENFHYPINPSLFAYTSFLNFTLQLRYYCICSLFESFLVSFSPSCFDYMYAASTRTRCDKIFQKNKFRLMKNLTRALTHIHTAILEAPANEFRLGNAGVLIYAVNGGAKSYEDGGAAGGRAMHTHGRSPRVRGHSMKSLVTLPAHARKREI